MAEDSCGFLKSRWGLRAPELGSQEGWALTRLLPEVLQLWGLGVEVQVLLFTLDKLLTTLCFCFSKTGIVGKVTGRLCIKCLAQCLSGGVSWLLGQSLSSLSLPSFSPVLFFKIKHRLKNNNWIWKNVCFPCVLWGQYFRRIGFLITDVVWAPWIKETLWLQSVRM